jgi:hypothetical protein
MRNFGSGLPTEAGRPPTPVCAILTDGHSKTELLTSEIAMPDSQTDTKSATWVANAIYDWAKGAGALALAGQMSGGSDTDLFTRLGIDRPQKLVVTEGTLKRLKIIAITGDDKAGAVAVLVRTQVSPTAQKRLPTSLDGITIKYIGQTVIDPMPPTVPLTSQIGGPRFSVVNGRFTCGSSITAAPIASAGTLGALVRLPDGTLCGLSNNHVTGDCNHTQVDMYVLCPSPIDADPKLPPPTAIGRHHRLVQLRSGDPAQVAKQEVDAAIFRIEKPEMVTSWQGESAYDTPTSIIPLIAGMKVKKFGRTTGETRGQVLGPVLTPIDIPYRAANFQSKVHFTGIWAVRGSGGDPFSEHGDSGALVVTEDGLNAVGLLFAGAGPVAFIMSIDKVLSAFDGAMLVGGHNL